MPPNGSLLRSHQSTAVKCDTADMDEVDEIPEERAPEPDVNAPNAARMYDYHLGGAANFAVDRAAIDDILEWLPEGSYYAQCNRGFLARAVRYLVNEAGIDQFLDLGSGVPTVGNVHEIAQKQNPTARVAYVDFEPVAVRHARALLRQEGAERVTVTEADIREPEAVWSSPGVAQLLDPDRPVAVLAVGVLPFIPDGEVHELVAAYREATVPGSYAAVSHISRISWTDEQMHRLMEIMRRTPTPERERSPDEIATLLPGYALVPPGLVPVPQWRPDRAPSDEEVAQSNCYGAVGRRL